MARIRTENLLITLDTIVNKGEKDGGGESPKILAKKSQKKSYKQGLVLTKRYINKT